MLLDTWTETEKDKHYRRACTFGDSRYNVKEPV